MNVTKLVRLGGRGQNQHAKPRLLLVTLDLPDRRRAILAAAKSLRHTEKWSNIYISPDLTPTEREKDKQVRLEMKERRDAGEKTLYIRGGQILVRQQRGTNGTESASTAVTKADNQ